MSREIGLKSEEAVCKYLCSKGFLLLERNYSIHNIGELDLVMRRGHNIYVVEVKSRLIDNISKWGTPELAVNSNKKRKTKNTTRVYLYKNSLIENNVVFLVAGVLHSRDGNIIDIKFFEFS